MKARIHLAVFDESPTNKGMTVCYAEVYGADLPDDATADEYARRLVVNVTVELPGQPAVSNVLMVPIEPEPAQLPVLPDDLPPDDHLA